MTVSEVTPIDWDTQPTVPRGQRLQLGARKLTSAHLALARRPQVCAEFEQSLAPIGSALSTRLKTPVQVTARLIDRGLFCAPELSAFGVFAVVELGAKGAVALVELEIGGVIGLVERLSGSASRTAPVRSLNAIEEAAFGFLWLQVLSAVKASARISALAPRLLWIGTDRAFAKERLPQKQALVQLELELGAAELTCSGRLWLASGAIQASLVLDPPALSGALSEELARATVPARVFVGKSSLSAFELEGLRVGDVVLFDGLAIAAGCAEGSARLVFSSFVVRGRFGADGFTPTQATPRGVTPESPMSTDPSELTPTEFPLELEVELTRVRVSLGELAQLKAGALLPLRISVSDPVTLRVGDRAVARAELVDIDGEVGARVLSLLP